MSRYCFQMPTEGLDDMSAAQVSHETVEADYFFAIQPTITGVPDAWRGHATSGRLVPARAPSRAKENNDAPRGHLGGDGFGPRGCHSAVGPLDCAPVTI